ncbi:fosfomycin resistance protein FosB [Klebsiella pneumoniae]|nr:fosfomycin resistance protein FosB [Klebsiella pneumoniae]
MAPEDFESFSYKLKQAGVTVWKDNKSEGQSFYFLDPDGHKLELHVGDLESRLVQCREKPYSGMRFGPRK